MTRLIMIFTLVGGLLYLYQARQHPLRQEPPPPPSVAMNPVPALSPKEIEKVRNSTKDAEASVRWAAIELLYRMHDPQAIRILENMMALDTEPSVRKNALNMLRQVPKPTALKDLLLALKDSEQDIRIAALMALGEIGDSSIAPEISKLLMDSETNVRLQALRTLGQFEEKKQAKYRDLARKMKEQYEANVRKSQSQAPPVKLKNVAQPQ